MITSTNASTQLLVSLLPDYNTINVNLVSYNVTEIPNSSKKKIFECLRNNIKFNDVNSLVKDEKNSQDDFQGNNFF